MLPRVEWRIAAFQSVPFSQKLLLFIFPPCATKAGERNPFSAFFVVQLVFRTQPYRQYSPPPPNLALI